MNSVEQPHDFNFLIKELKELVFLRASEELTFQDRNRMIYLLNALEDVYCLVEWPDIQYYMEEPWFEFEAILDVEHGSSTYFIPFKYVV